MTELRLTHMRDVPMEVLDELFQRGYSVSSRGVITPSERAHPFIQWLHRSVVGLQPTGYAHRLNFGEDDARTGVWFDLDAIRNFRMLAATGFSRDTIREYYRMWRRQVQDEQSETEASMLSEDAWSRIDGARRRLASLADGPVLARMPVHGPGVRSSRRWGIEVEAVDAAGILAPDGWTRKYDGSLRPYDYAVEPEYYDDDDDDGRVCHEFTSPILSHVRSAGLRTLTEALSERGVNETAGIHVHVEANDLTPKAITRLIMSYHIIEPLLMHDYGRDEQVRGEYARTYGPDMMMHQVYYNRQAANRGVHTPMAYERYANVNLEALHKFGTVEFRAMGAVYDYDHLIKWAAFCREMVNAAANPNLGVNRWMKVRTFQDVLDIFREFGVESGDGYLETPDETPVIQEVVTLPESTPANRTPGRDVITDILNRYSEAQNMAYTLRGVFSD